jgi:hypothetical protein
VYHPTEVYYAESQNPVSDGSPQIELGRSILLLDGLSHYFLSLPVKALLLNWQLIDHRLPPENLNILERYLELNQLRSVKVRHNQYSPLGELRRLRTNKEIGAGFRYTLGVFYWLRYTLIPDRIFAGVPFIGVGDHFNPFTNTIHIYSGDVTVLLHEAGHAKDYIRHETRGISFVLPRFLPGVDLIQEATASRDAIQFLYCIQDRENELRAYRTLIPAYSTYIGGYFSGGLVVFLPIVGVGHLAGRTQSQLRANAMDSEEQDSFSGFSRRDFLPPFCASSETAEELPDWTEYK